MCPVAAESKNSKSSSKKKINKKSNTSLEAAVEEDTNNISQTLNSSSDLSFCVSTFLSINSFIDKLDFF